MGNQICVRCGTVSNGRRQNRGSWVIELLLWLCLIVPGVLYSLWRLGNRYYECPACGSEDMVALQSPMGRKLSRELAE